MSLDKLICTQFSQSFEQNLKNELVIAKLAAVKYEQNLKFGDEANVIMPGRVSMADWSGGDLNSPEKVTSSIVKIKVNKGKQVNFEIERDKAIQIEGANQTDKCSLVDEYSSDARYQFRDAVDGALGALYPFAGYVLDDNDNDIALTADNAFDILSLMKAKFSRGINGSAWVTGKMAAIFPPEAIAVMLGMSELQYTESQIKDKVTGFVTEKAGWKIYESNNIAIPSTNSYRPLFGIEGETLACVIQSDMNLVGYMRDESLNNAFKGAAVYGVAAPRADKLGTVKLSISLSL